MVSVTHIRENFTVGTVDLDIAMERTFEKFLSIFLFLGKCRRLFYKPFVSKLQAIKRLLIDLVEDARVIYVLIYKNTDDVVGGNDSAQFYVILGIRIRIQRTIDIVVFVLASSSKKSPTGVPTKLNPTNST